jgi:hypothetical protein
MAAQHFLLTVHFHSLDSEAVQRGCGIVAPGQEGWREEAVMSTRVPVAWCAAAMITASGMLFGGITDSEPTCEYCGVIQSIAARDVQGASAALGGRAFERRRNTHTVYDVVVYMYSGETRRLTLDSVDGLREGAEVEIRDDRVVPA